MSTTENPAPRPADEVSTDRIGTREHEAASPVAPQPGVSTSRTRVLAIVAVVVGGLLALGLAFGGGFLAGTVAARFGGPGTAGGPGPGFDRPGGGGPGFGDRDGSRGDPDGSGDTEN